SRTEPPGNCAQSLEFQGKSGTISVGCWRARLAKLAYATGLNPAAPMGCPGSSPGAGPSISCWRSSTAEQWPCKPQDARSNRGRQPQPLAPVAQLDRALAF